MTEIENFLTQITM